MTWPIALADVRAARERIGRHLTPTPLRGYPELDAAIGHDIRAFIKHENHQPTCSFKVRNALSAVAALDEAVLRRGIVAATRGNHGQGLAFAGRAVGAPVVICVPVGNNPEKNGAMRALGAELIEEGRDYDEAVAVAQRVVRDRGCHLVHSTNDRHVIAGAATLTLEIVEQAPELDAMVIAVGGGSQAVGALTVARALRPGMPVYGVQAARASAIHDGWHAGHPVSRPSADTIADGLATRSCYELTFDALREGLAGFVTVSEDELAAAVRALLRYTHNLAEPAGAAGLAGLQKLAPTLAGKRVAIILSGANIDAPTLRQILA